MRTGNLHVTATYSDRDTEVVLVLDTSVEIGISAGIGGSSSNLDTGVRAAASIADHYLRGGDRVGLINVGRPGQPVWLRSGREHLFRVMEGLLQAVPGQVSEPGGQPGTDQNCRSVIDHRAQPAARFGDLDGTACRWLSAGVAAASIRCSPG
jgi:uncharacterized protein (DUF58 family)